MTSALVRHAIDPANRSTHVRRGCPPGRRHPLRAFLGGLLPGFAYQCGAAIAGTVVYIEAVLAGHTTYARAMALTAVIAMTFATVAASVGKERHGIAFGGLE